MKFSTHSFRDEIFTIGEWEGFKATPKILREIVANFSALRKILKVPLKLGHNEVTDINKKAIDGQPALGWVDSLELDNVNNPTTIFANYTDMPSIVFKAVKGKSYRTRSIELETMVKDGQLFKHVLTAVALLGSDLPRVNTLRDLDKYLMSKDSHGTDEDYDGYKVAQGRDTSITVSEQICFSINTNKEVGVMTPEEEAKLRADLAASQLETTQLKATNTTLTGEKETFSKQIDDRVAADKVAAVTTKRTEVTGLFETAVKAEVITPAQRESFSKLLGVDDDEKVILIDLENVKTLIGGDSTMFSKKDTSAAEGDQGDDERSPDEILTQKTFEHMEKHGSEDFEKAMFSVMRANPELAEENKLANGVKGD